MAEFGDRLRKLREQMFLTQEQCATRCGQQPSAWSRWETGGGTPLLDNLNAITHGMSLNANAVFYLVTGTPSGGMKCSPVIYHSLVRIVKEASEAVRLANRQSIFPEDAA